ncbi:cysteine desulfurase family protein [Desulfovibrio piger]|uniref:cysteine desulfurase family protein n=1 Tax=Desulfovibrio piger TaxID=901 RepID=UPI003F06A2BD
MLYFDANATTPCAPEVLEAMRPYWNTSFANASSPHRAGRVAAQAVAVARRAVAECLDARPHEIIFTSGATESTNLVFWGLLLAPRTRRHIVVSAIEHKAVLESAALLEEQGFEVTRLPVTPDGVVDLNIAARVITPETALVSVQAANNEIGTIQPILHIARLAHQAGAFFHVDAVQALGKMPVSMLDWECDFASFSAHKIYGPKGIGALFVKGGPMRWPWPRPLRGGGQEGGLRPGTLNVPGIVGFGAACEILRQRPAEILENIATLRDLLENSLKKVFNNRIRIVGENVERLPNTSGLLIKDIDTDILFLRCKNVLFSNGSACNSGTIELSHVVKSVLLDASLDDRFLRFSLLENTTKSDIELLSRIIQENILYE